MMTYELYKILHYIGIFITLMSLGGIGAHILGGGTKAAFPARQWLSTLHGMGTVLILIGGVGLHLRLLGREAPQGWEYAKALAWLILGGAPALFYSQEIPAKITWWIILAAAAFAALLGIFKPF